MDDIKKDVLAHMLVPMYQGAIHAAHKMDTPATASDGLKELAAYWNIIKDKVAFDTNPGDKPRMEALAASDANNLGTNNWCTVKALLHRNLPDGSKLGTRTTGSHAPTEIALRHALEHLKPLTLTKSPARTTSMPRL
jgi:hypothetical protein